MRRVWLVSIYYKYVYNVFHYDIASFYNSKLLEKNGLKEKIFN